jgi:hypothetical protein
MVDYHKIGDALVAKFDAKLGADELKVRFQDLSYEEKEIYFLLGNILTQITEFDA